MRRRKILLADDRDMGPDPEFGTREDYEAPVKKTPVRTTTRDVLPGRSRVKGSTVAFRRSLRR